MSWWNSLESVSNFNWYMQLGAIVFGVVTVVTTALIWISGNRASTLQSERDAAIRSRLERKQKPRGFTDEEYAKFVEIVSSKPRGKLIIFSLKDDKEAYLFARHINEAIAAAGYPPGIGQHDFTDVPVGLRILVRDPQNPPAHALVLQKAFMETGYDAPFGMENPPRPEDSIAIVVGIKD
jgi:hypothetical protein